MKIRKYLISLLAAFSIVPVLTVMISSISLFQSKTAEFLQKNAESEATQAADIVDQFFAQRKSSLEVTADLPGVKELLFFSNEGRSESELEPYRQMAINILKTMTSRQTAIRDGNSRGNYVKRSCLVNRENIVIASDDSEIIGTRSTIGENMRELSADKMYISNIMKNPIFLQGHKYFEVAVPIFSGSNYEGFIQSTIDMTYFDQICRRAFMETGRTFIIDPMGNIASEQFTDTDGNTLDNIKCMNGNSDFYQQLQKMDLEKHPSGAIFYSVNGENKCGYYSSVAGDRWIVVSAVKQEELLHPIRRIINIYIILLLIFIILMIGFSCLAANRFLNPIRDMSAAFVKVEQGDYQTQLSGTYKGEFAEMASSFNHLIEKIKEDTDVLKLNETRYALIMEETNQVVFEWDILLNQIYHTVYWTNKFGFSAVEEHPDSEIPKFRQVHPDDQIIMDDLFRSILQSKQPGPVDVRMKDISGKYIWCTVNVKALYDKENKPYRAIGLITDTDRQKKKIQQLENKSQMDLLTQLYNKVTAESLIKKHLKDCSRKLLQGFIIIDIDNFKSINDMLGHIFGDAVLKKVATEIKALFRATDVIGRTGGDEFIVFMKDLDSRELLSQKMKEICEVFRNAYTGEDGTYKVSASVGGAVFPDDGTTFAELYRHADEALYDAKDSGKDSYRLYSGALMEEAQ
ncbi:diguanylate cyclase [Caproiciproducens galactitolivorans]|uniref:Putative diguanylate cyclase YegE n=1 Tax=Caproiciproducens galactitolivorans TaxID=642589 RepID=A0A4Z0XYQ3_9FIRM|nr:diguanylate cyclase [Caproiciproducens galactitolivorans]QEY35114.1 diguanylate cyclase [Caproiciproducens galactitolivorans]TGJ76659.1 putative diguanylate cyclase YegE [Caproiciproducens galactitolivorans]